MNDKGKIGNTLHYPSTPATKAKYDAFCRAYHVNGNNATQAAIDAGYSKKTAGSKGSDLLKIVYIQDELQRLKNEAVEEYTITLEKRIRWLEKAVDFGFRDCADAQGNIRAENLAASISGVKELNVMLGTTGEEEEAKSLAINFSVNDAVGEVKVTNAST